MVNILLRYLWFEKLQHVGCTDALNIFLSLGCKQNIAHKRA